MKMLALHLIATITFGCAVATVTHAQTSQMGRGTATIAAQTPRTPDGHPDLTGLWTGSPNIGIPGYGAPAGAPASAATPPPAPSVSKSDDSKSLDPNLFNVRQAEGREGPEGFITLERDNTILRRMSANRPIYKPQYWDQVQKLDQDGNNADPGGNCMPAGVPRVGAPAQIMQKGNDIIFLYLVGGAAANPTTYRVFPIDGRAHTPLDDLDGTFNGESIGHWEGDTLVVDTIGFNTSTWIDIQGYFHSENMHVVERLTRDGDALTWQATVDDPDMFVKPWVMDAHTERLNPDPKAVLPESPACSERDYAHAVTKEHH